MKTIKVFYKGNEYVFTYFQTTINSDITFFVSTTDQDAIDLLTEDNFFITVSKDSIEYYFNADGNNEKEKEFKKVVAIKIVSLEMQ